MKNDWNRQRKRTRDLLLSYDIRNILLQPVQPQAIVVYPVEITKYIHFPINQINQQEIILNCGNAEEYIG